MKAKIGMIRMVVGAGLVLLAAGSAPGQGSMANASFEDSTAWLYSENDPYGKFSGGYSTAWASSGSRSYLLYRGTGYNGGGGWWGQIQQSGVDLTGVGTILFDVHAIGVDMNYLRWYVDSSLVGQYYVNSPSWGGVVDRFKIPVDVSAYTGAHSLTIRMCSDGDTGPADPKYYFLDNIRAIPEPATLSLIALGSIALFWRRHAA